MSPRLAADERALAWMVALMAVIKSATHAVVSLLDGRTTAALLWMVAATVMIATVIVIENSRAFAKQ